VRAILAALAASAALVGAYLALGGGSNEPTPPPDPCRVQVAPTRGQGLEATLERVGLEALAGAACDLKISREKLLLGLVGETRLGISDRERNDAFRNGLRRAIDTEQQQGRLGGAEAFLLRGTIAVLPIDALLERVFGSTGG
jgi:hypothetical protein